MQMDEGLDTGDMLLKKEIVIREDETGESLFNRLSKLGGPLLLETLSQAEQGTLRRVKQDDAESTYARMLSKELGKLDFSKDAAELERYVRGLNSWPSAYTYFRGKMMKIWRASVIDQNTELPCGAVVQVEKDGFCVQTGNGLLKVLEVQLEGKKRMKSADFLRGNDVADDSF